MSNKRPAPIKSPRRLRIGRADSMRGLKFCYWRQYLFDWSLPKFEAGLRERTRPFSIPGFCYVCGEASKFYLDDLHAYQEGTKRIPNFRERCVCRKCGLNTRLRASVHLFEEECRPEKNSAIYITEQATPFFRLMQARFPGLVGSEYLADKVPAGAVTPEGIRNESLVALTFADESYDFILCFDVIEHVPEFTRAFAECFRCLKPAGKLVFSVPFVETSPGNVLRARVRKDGEIEHLLSPEFHGDILRDAGCLCFHHFGWELLDLVRGTGFSRVYACVVRSRDYVYLGHTLLLFVAEKSPLSK